MGRAPWGGWFPVLLIAGCSGDAADSLRPPTVTVEVLPATPEQCPFGGQRVQSGIDRDGDGRLSSEEISREVLTCETTDDTPLSRTVVEPPGANCSRGGTRLETGIDRDGDGVLSSGEVTSTSFVCGGAIVVVDDVPPGEACPGGGRRIDTGVDLNRDGELSPDEVIESELICDRPPVSILTSDLPSALLARPYAATVIASSEVVGELSWEVVEGPTPDAGPLPAGLELMPRSVHGAPAVEIAGVPERAGRSRFTLRATDLQGRTAEAALELTVEAPLRITSAVVPPFRVGQSSSFQLEARDGVGQLTWSVAGHGLPEGLTLTSDGRIVGTPTRGLNESVRVRVEDERGAVVERMVGLRTEMRWALLEYGGSDRGYALVDVDAEPIATSSIAVLSRRLWGSLPGRVPRFAPGGDRLALITGASDTPTDQLELVELSGNEPSDPVIFANAEGAPDFDVTNLWWSLEGDALLFEVRRAGSRSSTWVDMPPGGAPTARTSWESRVYEAAISPRGTSAVLIQPLSIRFADLTTDPVVTWSHDTIPGLSWVGWDAESTGIVARHHRGEAIFWPFGEGRSSQPLVPGRPEGAETARIALSPTGSRAIAVLRDGRGSRAFMAPVPPEGVASVVDIGHLTEIEYPVLQWSPDGQLVLAGPIEGPRGFTLLSADPRAELMALDISRYFEDELVLRRMGWIDENRLWILTQGQTLFVWDLRSPGRLARLDERVDLLNSVAGLVIVDDHANWIAYYKMEGLEAWSLVVQSLEDPADRLVIPHEPFDVRFPAFMPDGRGFGFFQTRDPPQRPRNRARWVDLTERPLRGVDVPLDPFGIEVERLYVPER